MILLKGRGLISYYKEGGYDPILQKGVMNLYDCCSLMTSHETK
jgi:hypothetical protein